MNCQPNKESNDHMHIREKLETQTWNANEFGYRKQLEIMIFFFLESRSRHIMH